MKRICNLFVYCICIVCSCFVLSACTEPHADKIVEIPDTYTLDAKDLKDGKLPLNASVNVRLENMQEDTLYLVRPQSNSKAVGDASQNTKNECLVGLGDEFIVIPDEKGVVEFKGSDIGIIGSGFFDILPIKDGGRDDLTIKEDEKSFHYYNAKGEKVYMEVYHVDFSKAPYDKLDKSQIFLDTEWKGQIRGTSVGYITIGRGGLSNKGGGLVLHDFSDQRYVNFFTRLTVDNSKPESPRSLRFVMGNPTICNPDDPKGTAITETVWQYLIKTPTDKTKEYVLSIDCKGVNAGFDPQLVRTLDGKSVEMKPLRKDHEVINIAIGKITKDLIFNMNIFPDVENPDGYGRINIRPITDKEKEQLESDTVIIDKDKYVMEINVPADTRYMRTLIFKPSDATKPLNNLRIKVEYLENDGKTFVSPDRCYTGYKFGQVSGHGMARADGFGPYMEYEVPSDKVLDNLKLSLQKGNATTIRLTIDKSADDILFHDNSTLFILDKDGTVIETVKLPYGAEYTVESKSKDGFEFKGLNYEGKVYAVGNSFKLPAFGCGMAIWE